MADVSYPLQVVLGLVDHLSRPWSETLDKLSHSQNTFLTLGGRIGSSLLRHSSDFVREAFHVGEELEHSVNLVAAATSGSTEEILRHRGELEAMGRSTLAGTNAAAKAVATLSHAGNDLEESFAIATPALQLADVAQLDVASSARLLDRHLDAYGRSAKDAAKDADTLARASLALGEPIPAVADALQSLGPTAQALHVPLESVVEMMLAVHTKGLTAAATATKVRGALFALNKEGWSDAGGVLHIDEAIDTLRARGVTAADAMAKFGQRGGPGLAALLQVGTKGLRATDTELAKFNGLQEQQRIQNEGMVGATKELAHEWENLLLKVGTQENLENFSRLVRELVPLVESLAHGIGHVADAASAVNTLMHPIDAVRGGVGALGVLGGFADRVRAANAEAAAAAAAPTGAPVYTGPMQATRTLEFGTEPPAKAEVTIKLRGFPKGTQVETKGDAAVQTDLGLAMPGSGGGN